MRYKVLYALVLRGKTNGGKKEEEWEKFLTSIGKKAALSGRERRSFNGAK